eukprot:TRINITY_DN2768_c1_g1_i1.p1 TRINITY_DN2768_c1_g1~~TRINITY_DN2768_c1_g1_i1.p1  ORF type:complete len:1226 (-),score=488.73 TRINITY_DN2768_c1_g1_i1:54-3224(-)
MKQAQRQHKKKLNWKKLFADANKSGENSERYIRLLEKIESLSPQEIELLQIERQKALWAKEQRERVLLSRKQLRNNEGRLYSDNQETLRHWSDFQTQNMSKGKVIVVMEYTKHSEWVKSQWRNMEVEKMEDDVLANHPYGSLPDEPEDVDEPGGAHYLDPNVKEIGHLEYAMHPIEEEQNDGNEEEELDEFEELVRIPKLSDAPPKSKNERNRTMMEELTNPIPLEVVKLDKTNALEPSGVSPSEPIQVDYREKRREELRTRYIEEEEAKRVARMKYFAENSDYDPVETDTSVQKKEEGEEEEEEQSDAITEQDEIDAAAARDAEEPLIPKEEYDTRYRKELQNREEINQILKEQEERLDEMEEEEYDERREVQGRDYNYEDRFDEDEEEEEEEGDQLTPEAEHTLSVQKALKEQELEVAQMDFVPDIVRVQMAKEEEDLALLLPSNKTESKPPAFEDRLLNPNKVEGFFTQFVEAEWVEEGPFDTEVKHIRRYLENEVVKDQSSPQRIVEQLSAHLNESLDKIAAEVPKIKQMNREDTEKYIREILAEGKENADKIMAGELFRNEYEIHNRELRVPPVDDALNKSCRYYWVVSEFIKEFRTIYEIETLDGKTIVPEENEMKEYRLRQFNNEVIFRSVREPTPVLQLRKFDDEVKERGWERYPYPGTPVELPVEEEEEDYGDDEEDEGEEAENNSFVRREESDNGLIQEMIVDIDMDNYQENLKNPTPIRLREEKDVLFYANQQLDNDFAPARQFAIIDFIESTITFMMDSPDRMQDVIKVPTDWMNTFKQMYWPPTPESYDYQWFAHMIDTAKLGLTQESNKIYELMEAVNFEQRDPLNLVGRPWYALDEKEKRNSTVGLLKRIVTELEEMDRTRFTPQELQDLEAAADSQEKNINDYVKQIDTQRDKNNRKLRQQRRFVEKLRHEGKISLPDIDSIREFIKSFKSDEFLNNGLYKAAERTNQNLRKCQLMGRNLSTEGKVDYKSFTNEERNAFLRYIIEHEQIQSLNNEFDKYYDVEKPDTDWAEFVEFQRSEKAPEQTKSHLLDFGIITKTKI